jgi:hypothetical protein
MTRRSNERPREEKTAGPPFRKLAIVATSTLASLAMLPSVALGADQAAPVSPADEFSATDQYVESVPTSRGPKAPAVQERPKAPLPPAVSARLDRDAGAAAAKLEQVATSPDLGAPPPRSDARTEQPRHARAVSAPSVPSAAVSAVGEGEDGSLLRLLGALALITGLAVGTAGYRHHKHKSSAG